MEHSERRTGNGEAEEAAGRKVPTREEIKRQFDEEFAEPGSGKGFYLDPNEIIEIEYDPRFFLNYEGMGLEPDRSDHPPAKWVWVWRPWYIWLPCLVLGFSLFVGSFSLPEALAAFGYSFVDASGNDWSGALRLLMTFIGLFVLAMAAPVHQPEGWTQQDAEALEADRQYFHRKKFGG